MMRSELHKKYEIDFANDLFSFTNTNSSPTLDINPFQNIILAGCHPNSTKIQKKQDIKLSNISKLSLKTIKNISTWQSQSQKNIQPLTTLLNIKRQVTHSKKNIFVSQTPNNQKKTFKIYEMFKIDEFLNSKKSHQQSQSDLSSSMNNNQVDEQCDTQTAPASDFIKYTLTDKCGSQSSRSYNNKSYTSPKGGLNSCNTEFQNIVSPKSSTQRGDEQKSTLAEQFVQTQRRLKPQHKMSNSLYGNSAAQSSDQLLNSAKKQTSTFQATSYKHSLASQISPNNKNTIKSDFNKGRHCPNPSLIMNLLDIEKNQDFRLTKNYDESVKVSTEIENLRKMSIPGGTTQDKREEEQKQKYMKKVLDQPSEEGGGRKPSREKVSKLTITNPLFTEVDKSQMADRSQIYMLHQLKLKHQQKGKQINKKARIWSAQPQMNNQKQSSTNGLVSSSFFGNSKEQSSNACQSKNQLKEEEVQSNQNLLNYHLQGGDKGISSNNTNINNSTCQLNQSKELLKKAQQLSHNQIKQMIHPELQSFTSIQKRSSKELVSQLNMTSSQSNLKSPNKSTNHVKKRHNYPFNNNNKSNTTGKKSMQMSRSKTLEEDQNLKEAASNLTIYKYSSNYYRPQTAKIQTSSNTSAQKQKDKYNKRSFNSLKSWENNDIDDQSVCI